MAKTKNIQQPAKQEKPDRVSGVAAFCETAVFWLLVAAIFLVPLYFNIESYDQFELPKLTVLRVLVSLMLGLWLVRVFDTGKFNYVATPLDIPMALWAVWNIVTTLTSFAPFLSFRGEYENFAGSLTNLTYVVLYFIATHHVRTGKHVSIINAALLASGALVTFYAVSQFLGFDFVKWSSTSVIKDRYFATMGNPNFLGALLIMVIPAAISFFMIFFRQNKVLPAAGLIPLFVLAYISLFGTQSRGPMLGFAASIAFLASYGIYRLYKNHAGGIAGAARKNIIWIIAIVAALAMALTLSLVVGKKATARLVASVADIKGSLKQSRLHIWIPGLKIVKDHPFIGTGVDTFKTVFPRYETTEFSYIDGANVSSRTAHNEPLNIAATMGLTGLGIYLLMIWVYVLAWAKSFRAEEDFSQKILSLGMFAAFVAYFTQNFFSFGVAAINVIFYLFMAAHMASYARRRNKTGTLKLFEPGSDSGVYVKIGGQLASAALCLWLAYSAFSLFEADMYYNRGKILAERYAMINPDSDYARNQKIGHGNDSIINHIKAVRKAPREVKYHVYYGLSCEQQAFDPVTISSARRSELLTAAAREYNLGVSLNPGNAYYWGNLGRLYVRMALSSDNLLDKKENFSKAIEYYKRSTTLAPVTELFYNNLVDVYSQSGMFAEGEQYFKSRAAQDPGNVFFNYSLGRLSMAYASFAQGAQQKSAYEAAISNFTVCVERDYLIESFHTRLAEAYFKSGRLNEGAAYFDSRIGKDTNDVYDYRAKGYLYRLAAAQSAGKAKEGFINESAVAYNLAVAKAPVEPASYNDLFSLYMDAGRLNEAVQVFERAAQNKTTAAATMGFALGNTFFTQNSFSAARMFYQRTIAINPEMLYAYFNLAITSANLGEKEEALKAFDTLMKLAPSFERADEVRRITAQLKAK